MICPCQKFTRISSIVTGFLNCARVCIVLMGKTIYPTKENVFFCVNMLVKVLSKCINKEETHLNTTCTLLLLRISFWALLALILLKYLDDS